MKAPKDKRISCNIINGLSALVISAVTCNKYVLLLYPLVSGNETSTGQGASGTVAGWNGSMSSMLLGSGNGDDEEDPPEEQSSKLPRRFRCDD